MWNDFPQPVSLDPDEADVLVVHRDVAGAHQESRACWCVPWVYSQEELWQADFIDRVNANIAAGIQ